MSVTVVRVARHDWPRAFERLTVLGVTFSTGLTVFADDFGPGYVEVVLPSAVAPVLDGFTRVRDD